jgi:aminodeoxychorismate synthase component I
MHQRIAAYHWIEPLEALQALGAQKHLAFLYSSQKEHHTGSYSFLAWGLAETVTGSHFAQIPKLPAETAYPIPLWFGYIGYEMRGDIEPAARLRPASITFPDMRWNQYVHTLRFDHEAKKVEYYTLHDADPMRMEDMQPYEIPEAERPITEEIFSNFTAASYQQAVKETVEAIKRGDFYQANLTRKFFGEMDRVLDPVQTFIKLTEASPAPYSALIRMDDTAILSSSPECFLSVNSEGTLLVRPIKGSARRSDNPQEDEAIIAALRDSEKDRAENLMIVDLMRHDLAQIAIPGSVQLEQFAELQSYRTIHHLISTIRAQKKPNATLRDILRAVFPPGSMTGAPKIAAMSWCAAQERLERGVYSGALGWLGAGDTGDLSVVIRTVLIQGNKFEFQAGGGIVADSDPVLEWQETLAKTRGIARALPIDEALLHAL